MPIPTTRKSYNLQTEEENLNRYYIVDENNKEGQKSEALLKSMIIANHLFIKFLSS